MFVFPLETRNIRSSKLCFISFKLMYAIRAFSFNLFSKSTRFCLVDLCNKKAAVIIPDMQEDFTQLLTPKPLFRLPITTLNLTWSHFSFVLDSCWMRGFAKLVSIRVCEFCHVVLLRSTFVRFFFCLTQTQN